MAICPAPPPGTCPGRRGAALKLGKIQAHKWGGYNARSHMLGCGFIRKVTTQPRLSELQSDTAMIFPPGMRFWMTNSLMEVPMRLLLFAGAVAAITLLVPTCGMAAGTEAHEFRNEKRGSTAAMPQVPYLGCGSHRVFDPKTRTCRGPGDF